MKRIRVKASLSGLLIGLRCNAKGLQYKIPICPYKKFKNKKAWWKAFYAVGEIFK